MNQPFIDDSESGSLNHSFAKIDDRNQSTTYIRKPFPWLKVAIVAVLVIFGLVLWLEWDWFKI